MMMMNPFSVKEFGGVGREGASWRQISVAKREGKYHSWLLDKRSLRIKQRKMLGLVSTVF